MTSSFSVTRSASVTPARDVRRLLPCGAPQDKIRLDSFTRLSTIHPPEASAHMLPFT